jgi:hypothetical protein
VDYRKKSKATYFFLTQRFLQAYPYLGNKLAAQHDTGHKRAVCLGASAGNVMRSMQSIAWHFAVLQSFAHSLGCSSANAPYTNRSN